MLQALILQISNKLLLMYGLKKLEFFSVLAILICLSSCQVIGDIFKAGVWSGVILVVVVVGLIIFAVAKLFGGGK